MYTNYVHHQPFMDDLIGQRIPYNFIADSIHTKKLCSRLSSSEVQFQMKNGHFARFEPTVHHRLAYCKVRSGLPISEN